MLNKWFAKKQPKPPAGAIPLRQSKPKELLTAIGRDLVTRMNQDPDWVWALLNVTQSSPDNPHVVLFRVFDPHEAAVRGTTVKNYQSLDEHPELILYHGWVNTRNNAAEVIDSRQKPPVIGYTH